MKIEKLKGESIRAAQVIRRRKNERRKERRYAKKGKP